MITVRPAFGAFATVIACLLCTHHPSDAEENVPDEWWDSNDDTYFTGSSVAGLKAFLARHEVLR
jgi:hypothetical protein